MSLEHRQTMAALCLVCRLFCEYCQQSLFQSLCYCGNSDLILVNQLLSLKTLEVDKRRSLALFRLLDDCTFYYWPDPAPLNNRLNLAVDFGNITLDHCTLSLSNAGALSELKRLRSVAFVSCRMERTVYPTAHLVSQLSTSFWRSVSIQDVQNSLHWFLDALLHLIDVHILCVFCMDNLESLTTLLEDKAAFRLEKLSI